MPIEPGTRLGPYEVLGPIGTEGEERYKASDTRKNQVVALKVLPPEFSSRPEMKTRLEHDARTISSLNHPQICAIVDVGHQDPSTDFVVAEFIEGESLAERLARGPMELHEAIAVAIAIADSLDKAHRRDVVHGGLNPSVVLLTTAGPKLMDFGVAKASHGVELLDSTTMATTQTALSALSAVPSSAARYMAPEQFAGGRIDARTDIFSLGAILYELVTGRPVFQEKTQALLIAAVQTVDPEPPSKLRPATPPELDYVITRCLSKDPKQRLQTAFDVMSELQWMTRGATEVGIVIPTATSRKRDRVVWVALAAALVLAAALTPAVLSSFGSVPAREEVRFIASSLPDGTTPIAISPDGRWVAAAINAGPIIGLSLDSVTSQVLVSGDDSFPAQPFWSPDSRSIAYFEGNKLKRSDVGGAPPQIISDALPRASAGTWNNDGVILFPGDGRIQRVLAAGGQSTPVTTLDQSREETGHTGPSFLPDGRHFLFLATSSKPGESAIYVGSLDSTERTRLFASETKAVYAAPGYLLFNRGDTVFAHEFDANALALKGEPIRVASGVAVLTIGGNLGSGSASAFAVSQTGVLAYRTGRGSAPAGPISTGPDEQRSLVWVERSGVRSALEPTGTFAGIDLSPDGRRFAVHRHEGTGGDNWFFDLAQGRMQRLTFGTSQENSSPVWSPDGTKVAFASQRNGKSGLYVKLADGSAAEELITESDVPKVPMSWSADGKLLLYTQPTGDGDVWAVPVTGDRKPYPVLQESYSENFPQVSPDGKWLAYQTNETGRAEIYVTSFPKGPSKWLVSQDGGQYPRWRRDGKELFFYFNNNMIAADITVKGSSIEPGVPRTLFQLSTPSTAGNHGPYHRFAVTGDGQRFLISQLGAVVARGRGARGVGRGGEGLAAAIAAAADQEGNELPTTGNPITIVLNWTEMLKQK
jgi:serine/threonine protein kinase